MYNTKALEIARATEDAFSFRRYISWLACATMLLRRGYTEAETKKILRSKITRWAADRSSHGEGKATSKDIESFIDKYPKAITDLLSEV